MKLQPTQLPNGKNSSSSPSSSSYTNFIQLLSLTLTLFFLTSIPFCFLNNSRVPTLSSAERSADDHGRPFNTTTDRNSTSSTVDKSPEDECDVFNGRWVPNSNGSYYTNATCNLIIDEQNCMKFGRNDTEFLEWRWKPDQCELPVFKAVRFLEVVAGKSMAFVGDSVGRNQMQSLLCLLSSVAYPEDRSSTYTNDTTTFKKYFYKDYNFTLAILWSPYLVKANDAGANGNSTNNLMSLKLDEVDEAWTSKVENFTFVIISAGQWFFRPLVYYINDTVVGCHLCNEPNITSLTTFYGYKTAFKTAFKALQNLENYNGVTFLRTYSPSHYENGDWNNGGSCVRTKPFTKDEMEMNMEWYNKEMKRLQVEGLKEILEEDVGENGLVFRVLATTEAMWMRPDGHPNHYGRSRSVANDCVHWCLPGPIDTWNEFLLYMLEKEDEKKLMKKSDLIS